MATVPQTATRQRANIAFQGQLYEPEQASLIDTKILEVAANPGLFLTRGTTDTFKGAAPPDAAGDITTLGLLLGVGVYVAAREPLDPQFSIGDAIAVVRKGLIAVLANGTVTDGGPCYIVFDNTTPTNIRGSVRADAGGGTIAAVAPAGTRIYRGAAAGAVCIVEVNLPGA